MSDLFAIPRSIELLDSGTPVRAPDAMVYSTAPRFCNATDGKAYVVKGADDPDAVAAEAIGYTFAKLLDLEVPDFAVADGGRLFASLHVDGCFRDPAPFFADHLPMIARVILLDVFLFNDDRNVGAFVAHPSRGLVALDFEKSKVVRLRHPLVELATLDPKKVWPRGALREVAGRCKMPDEFRNRIEQLTDVAIHSVVQGVAQAVPAYTWGDASELALRSRRDNFRKLVAEVWR